MSWNKNRVYPNLVITPDYGVFFQGTPVTYGVPYTQGPDTFLVNQGGCNEGARPIELKHTHHGPGRSDVRKWRLRPGRSYRVTTEALREVGAWDWAYKEIELLAARYGGGSRVRIMGCDVRNLRLKLQDMYANESREEMHVSTDAQLSVLKESPRESYDGLVQVHNDSVSRRDTGTYVIVVRHRIQSSLGLQSEIAAVYLWPGVDMSQFRAALARALFGKAAPPMVLSYIREHGGNRPRNNVRHWVTRHLNPVQVRNTELEIGAAEERITISADPTAANWYGVGAHRYLYPLNLQFPGVIAKGFATPPNVLSDWQTWFEHQGKQSNLQIF